MASPTKETWFKWFEIDFENGKIFHKQLVRYATRYIGQEAEDSVQGFYSVFPIKALGYKYDINLDIPISDDKRAKKFIFASLSRYLIDFYRGNKRWREILLYGDAANLSCPDDNEYSNYRTEDKRSSPLETLGLNEENQILRTRLRSQVNGLPEKLKRAVDLVYYQGLKYKEAADILQIPIGTVKSQIHAAKALLKESFADKRAA